MNRFFIVGGGTVDTAFVKSYMEHCPPAQNRLIAADGGLGAISRMGLVPDVVLGDFDSADPNLLEELRHHGAIHFEQFPTHKDYTDMELAVDHAIRSGGEELHIFGGTGTRLDHVLGNIHVLQKPMELGITARLVDRTNIVELFGPGRHVIDNDLKQGRYISFLPYAGPVEGVTLTGFAYPLDHGRIEPGTTLGISNELRDAKGIVSIERGILICIRSRD